MAAQTHYRLISGRPKLRRGHPMASGLAGAWCFLGGYGQDLVGTNHLSPGGGVTYDGAAGLGTNVAGAYYQCNVNASLKLAPPVTLVWQGSTPVTGSRTVNSQIFGVSYTNSNTSPFVAYAFAVDAAGSLVVNLNNSGSFQQMSFSSALGSGSDVWLAAILQSGSSFTYINDPGASGATKGNVSGINYGTTPLLSFGSESYLSANSLCSHQYGLIYNRSLPLGDLQWLYAKGRDLFARNRSWAGWVAALGAKAASGTSTATLDVSPTRIRPNQTTTISFILNGGTWGAAPGLTPSGTASSGVSIGSVTLVNPTLATASVTYGSATGTLTWTESSGNATRNQIVGPLVRFVPRRF